MENTRFIEDNNHACYPVDRGDRKSGYLVIMMHGHKKNSTISEHERAA